MEMLKIVSSLFTHVFNLLRADSFVYNSKIIYRMYIRSELGSLHLCTPTSNLFVVLHNHGIAKKKCIMSTNAIIIIMKVTSTKYT